MTSIPKVPPRELVELAAQFLVARFKLFGSVKLFHRRAYGRSKLRPAHRSCFHRLYVSLCPPGMQKYPLVFSFVHGSSPLKGAV